MKNKFLIFIICFLFLIFCGILATLITDFILSITDNNLIIKALQIIL